MHNHTRALYMPQKPQPETLPFGSFFYKSRDIGANETLSSERNNSEIGI